MPMKLEAWPGRQVVPRTWAATTATSGGVVQAIKRADAARDYGAVCSCPIRSYRMLQYRLEREKDGGTLLTFNHTALWTDFGKTTEEEFRRGWSFIHEAVRKESGGRRVCGERRPGRRRPGDGRKSMCPFCIGSALLLGGKV